MAKLTIMDHPLIQHKLSLIRQKDRGAKEFRELVEEVAMLMAYEVTRHLPLKEVEIETPVAIAKTNILAGKKLGVVAILRAGLGMISGFVKLIPAAKIGHIGIYRDPDTLEPVEYFSKLPQDVADREILVVDPMLATGGSASAALSVLKNKGARQIKLVVLVAAPEGVARIQKDHPDVEIFTAALDEGLNDHAYIIPGLGDAGDRFFGTK
ncbi:uracil phosphoribosyltransferase [Heliorestis acidaminivorans]|uniref:Uracil phosphoribosyltransferase n=1 Tax=Heliorestis acidaminivorans TaxID=553427 RepID=A0A6I0F345_9FIRM|nr:uracil phosphoribosyltransferase [Heliorestis acidaminivorans]KAB2953813.1 uracil phosphoribosyltransferase [Heliorestis acidaminivorans]